MRQLTAWSFVLILTLPAFGRDRTPQEEVRRIKAGAPIEVSLVSGELLRGRMGGVSNTGFAMEPVKVDQGKSRTVEYTEVRRIRGTRHTTRNVVVISLVTVGVTAGGLVSLLKASGL